MVEDKNKALAAGMNDHLSKPIDPNQLYLLLAQHLAAASPEPQTVEKPTLLLVCLDKNELKKQAKQASAEYRVKVSAHPDQAKTLIEQGGLDEVWLVVTEEHHRQELQALQGSLEADGVLYDYQENKAL